MRWAEFLLPLLLVLGIAGAASAAGKATVYRCTAELTEINGAVTVVPGWGADQEMAASQARRWARILAAERFGEQVWTWLFWDDPLDAENARQLLAQGAEDNPLRTPGARIEDGSCQKVRLPGKGPRWEAVWSAGRVEEIVREAPSTAIEAARRRACMGADDESRAAIFQAVAHLSEDEKATMWRVGLTAAVDELFACVSGGEPSVRAVDGNREGSDSHAAYQCVAFTFTDAGEVAAVGWSVGLERAGEEALTELVYNRRRAALGYGLKASATASPETRQMMQAVGYSSSMPGVAESDLADRGRLGCVGFDADQALTLGWAPGTAYAAQRCGDRPHLPPAADISSVRVLDEERDDLCRDRAYYGVGLANKAVAAASPESAPIMARAGWGVSLTCESDCVANTTLVMNANPVAVPGIPQRASQEAAETLLLQAILFQDMERLLLVAPAFGEVASRPEFLDRFPVSFWLRLPPLIKHGIEEGEIAWRQLGGQWALMPVD